MRNLILGLILGASIFGVGCVSSSRYEGLKKQYDTARADLGQAKAEDQRLRKEAEEHARTIWGLRAKVRQEQNDRAAVEAWGVAVESDNGLLLGELERLSDDRNQLQKTRDKLKESLAALTARKTEADKNAAELRGIVDRWKTLIDAGTLSVSIVGGRMVLTLPSDVLFDSGSAKLSKDGKAAAQEVGAALATMPERHFQVEGHTDNVPISNEQFPSNWELASARALGVVRSLLGAGMQTSQLSAASYGEFQPVMANDSPQGRRENRRIEIILLPDLSKAPDGDQPQSLAAR